MDEISALVKRLFSRQWVLVVLGIFLIFTIAACSGTAPLGNLPDQEAEASTTPVSLPPTWTPAPPTPTVPSPTPSPRATWTPISSNTPRVTLAASATIYPPVELAVGQDTVPFTHEIIFIESGHLMVVDRDTGKKVELEAYGELGSPEPVGEGTPSPVSFPQTSLDHIISYTLDKSRSRLLIIRHEPDTNFELLLYSISDRRLEWVKEITEGEVLQTAISDDGVWGAYLRKLPGLDPDVRFLPLNDPEQSVHISVCGPECAGLLWRPQRNTFVWGDNTGLWQADPEAAGNETPELLLEPFLSGVVNNQSEYGSYRPRLWSPSGRYVVLGRGLADESQLVLLDTISNRVEKIPGPFVYVPSDQTLTWSENDELIITRVIFEGQEDAPLEFWSITPTNETFFTKVNELFYDIAPAEVLFSPALLADGSIVFGILDFSTPSYMEVNGIYALGKDGNSAEKLADIPFLPVNEVLWEPNGTAALIISDRRVLLVPFDGGTIYNLSVFFDSDTCCYSWLP